MLRIGIWIDESHISYGGPAAVFTGALQGLLEDAEKTQRPIRILLNEQGDVNWVMSTLPNHAQAVKHIRNPVFGPFVFGHEDSLIKDPSEHVPWANGHTFIIPSQWFANLIQQGLPMGPPRSLKIWEAGVDTKFFTPSSEPKTQDYFIYFKSQNYDDLRTVHVFLFQNYFKISGTTITYYHYTPSMLRDAAQKSKFCIFMSNTETQGLASLEILACGCPLFVIDCTTFKHKKFTFHGATSVSSWSPEFGMKTSIQDLERDFPIFFEKVTTYKPRDTICEKYSYAAAAHSLREILESI